MMTLRGKLLLRRARPIGYPDRQVEYSKAEEALLISLTLRPHDQRLKRLLLRPRRGARPASVRGSQRSVPQQPGALRSTTGSAPQAVATPGLTGPNDERILLSAG